VVSIAVLLVAARLVRACRRHLDGTEVRVHNADTRALRAVRVTVRGHTYDLGDLPPGMTRAVTVKPTSDSSVEVSLTDNAGRRDQLPAFGYVEPGTSGWVRVDLTETTVRSVEYDLDPY
jgi:hypothetical protein